MDSEKIVRRSGLHADMAATAQTKIPRLGEAQPLSVAVLSQEQNLASLSCCFHPTEAAGQVKRGHRKASVGFLPGSPTHTSIYTVRGL